MWRKNTSLFMRSRWVKQCKPTSVDMLRTNARVSVGPATAGLGIGTVCCGPVPMARVALSPLRRASSLRQVAGGRGRGSTESPRSTVWPAVAAITAAAVGTVSFASAEKAPVTPVPAPASKVFTRAEVKTHRSNDTGVWVTFEGNVYDITDFVVNHPGGVDKSAWPGVTPAASRAISPTSQC